MEGYPQEQGPRLPACTRWRCRRQQSHITVCKAILVFTSSLLSLEDPSVYFYFSAFLESLSFPPLHNYTSLYHVFLDRSTWIFLMTSSLLKLHSWKRIRHTHLQCATGNVVVSFSQSAVLPKLTSPPPKYFHSSLFRPLSNHCQSPFTPRPTTFALSHLPTAMTLSGSTSPNHCRRPPFLTHLLNPFMRAGIFNSSSARAVSTAVNAENSKQEREEVTEWYRH